MVPVLQRPAPSMLGAHSASRACHLPAAPSLNVCQLAFMASLGSSGLGELQTRIANLELLPIERALLAPFFDLPATFVHQRQHHSYNILVLYHLYLSIVVKPARRIIIMSSRVFSALPRALGRRAAPLRATRVSQFHTSRPLLVSQGDSLPNRDFLVENSPGNKVNLANEFANIKRGIVIGVPAAFSPACSNQHIPGYINHPKVAEIIGEGGKVVVVSVNDPFV
jgi:hypothetical protein